MERAINSANLAVSAVNLVLAEKVHKTVKSESLRTQSLAQNPMASFYMVDDDNTLKPPAQLPAPRVRRDGDLLVVSWSDPNNTKESLKFYELKYTDADQLPSIPPKYTSVKLGMYCNTVALYSLVPRLSKLRAVVRYKAEIIHA